ncbi:MAG: hypothetical protein OZSIB_3988 [Candidatus Ozemobacter sibiricus]|jgi:hypothetical protein|uniref:Uncharacterized protein n=1 Tax=Candidatus Ozemobacter sibiricus TaxID=2268124 RepID=A0A367ZNX7_9BACT|nr:MAG: hypothetical protein OZSIB_3988 [Candidatus Ozemobacter sibiricus]
MKTAKRPVSMLLILSIVTSFFLLPARPAHAGILGSFLQAIRPLAGIAGKVAGAVIGASLCGAFCPPLGMIAGGIMGWIAGGIITGYGTSSLTNLATLAGGVVGAMALGPGAVGMVGGFLLGAFLGRMAMRILHSADNTITGGILFKKATSGVSNLFGGARSTSSPAFTPTVPAASSLGVTVSGDRSAEIQAAESKYKAAYQNYIEATQKGDSKAAAEAHKIYLNAYQTYQNLSAGK